MALYKFRWTPCCPAVTLLLILGTLVCLTSSDVAPPLTMGPEVLTGEATLVRERRGDSYGGYGGGGYGGGMSYGGGGGYGCTCPYVSCDKNDNNGILAFGVGALLGLLLALLRALATAPAPAPAPGRQFFGGVEDHVHNVTWSAEAARNQQGAPIHKSSLMELLHLPESFGNDVGPMMSDLLQIYTKGNKHPECMRRWVCEATRQSQSKGGIAARLGSLSSIAYAWYTKDLSAILQNILPGTKDVDCKYLSPKCEVSFADT